MPHRELQPRIIRRAPLVLVGIGPRGIGAGGRMASSAFIFCMTAVCIPGWTYFFIFCTWRTSFVSGT